MESLYDQLKKKVQQQRAVGPQQPKPKTSSSGQPSLYERAVQQAEIYRAKPKPTPRPSDNEGFRKAMEAPLPTTKPFQNFGKALLDPKSWKNPFKKETWTGAGEQVNRMANYAIGRDLDAPKASDLTDAERAALEKFKSDSITAISSKIDQANKNLQESRDRTINQRGSRFYKPDGKENILSSFASGNSEAQAAKDNYESARRNYELIGSKAGTGFKGNFYDAVNAIKEDWQQNLGRKAPFAGAAADTTELIRLKKAVDKQQAGQGISIYEDSLIEKYKSRFAPVQQSTGANVGKTISQMPTFVAEFVLTSGMTSKIKTALTAKTKSAALNALSKTAATSAQALAQTAINVPEVSRRTLEYTLPTYKLASSEDGQSAILTIDKQGDSFQKAFFKAFGTTYADYLSEYAGELAEAPLKSIKQFTLAKWMAKNKVTTPGMLSKFKEAISWNGIIGEVFEEELAEMGQAPIEGRPYQAPFLTLEGGERLKTEALAIAPLGGVGKVSTFANNTLRNMMTGKQADQQKKEDTQGVSLREQMSGERKIPVVGSGATGKVSVNKVKPTLRQQMTEQANTPKQEQDWEDNYSERSSELYGKISLLEMQLKEAKKKDRPAIQAKIDALNKEDAALEEEFLSKHKGVGLRKGDKVQFQKIKDGKVTGLDKKVWSVKEIARDTKKVELVDEKGEVIWTTEETIESIKPKAEGDAYKPKAEGDAYKPTRKVQEKSIYDTRIIQGEYKGKRFTSNSYILEFDSNVQPSSSYVEMKDIKDGPKIDSIIPTKGKKAEIVRVYDNGGKNNKYVDLNNGKETVTVSKTYYDYFAKKYPGAEFYVTDGKTAILIKQNGKDIGLLMPVLTDGKSGMGFNKKSVVIWNKPAQTKKPKAKAKETPKLKSNLRVTNDGTSYASKGGMPIGTFERFTAKPGTQTFKLFEKVEGFIRKYAGIFGEGYVTRNSRGVFFKDTRNIYLKGLNDLSVAVHEVTHYIDNKLGITDTLLKKTDHGAELRQKLTLIYTTYYPGGKSTHNLKLRMVEGLATFFQKYIEQPKLIKETYPEVYRAFMVEGGMFYHKVFSEMETDLRTIISEYQGLDANAKIGAHVTNRNSKVAKQWLSFWDKVWIEFMDNIWWGETLSERLGTAMTHKDVSLRIRQAKNAAHIGTKNIVGDTGTWLFVKGELTQVSKHNWGDLIKLLYKDKIADSFAYHLVSRDFHFQYKRLNDLKERISYLVERIDEEEAKGNDPKALRIELREKADIRDNLQEILSNNSITKQEADESYELNKERFKEYEEMFDALTQAELNYLLDVQLINPEIHKELSSREGYASLKRSYLNEFTAQDDTSKRSGVSVNNLQVSSMISRKGSTQAIVNPLYSHIKNHMEIVRKGMWQQVYNEILKEWTPHLGNLLEERKLEVIVDKETGRVSYPQAKDENYIMARRDYKLVPILVDSNLKEMINEIAHPEEVSKIGHISRYIASVFTRGTTATYFPFFLQNIMVDQPTAYVNSTNNFKPIASALRTFMLSWDSTHPDYKYLVEYLQLGGDYQTFAKHLDEEPNILLNRIANEATSITEHLSRLKQGMSILDTFATPGQKSEIMTRAAEYIQSRKNGNPQMVAYEQAGRVSASFHHIGSWKFGSKVSIKNLVRSMVFFNAALQVNASLIRTLNTPEGRMRAAIAMGFIISGFGASLATLMLAGNDDQKEEFRQLDPRLFAKYIYIPKPTGKGLLRFRIPEFLAVPGALMNMVALDIIYDQRYSKREYFDTSTIWIPEPLRFWEGWPVLLRWTPQAVKPAFLVIANKKDYPTIRDLENQSVQRFSPRYRTYDSTEWHFKELGRLTGLSPIKLEYLVTSYLSRSSYYVTKPEIAANPFGGFFHNFYVQNSRDVQFYYDVKKKNEERYNDHDKGKGELSKEELQHVKDIRKVTKDIDDLMNDIKELDEDKDREKILQKAGKIYQKVDKLREMEK